MIPWIFLKGHTTNHDTSHSQADRYLCKVTFLLLLLRILPRFQNAKFGLWSSCCPSKTFELKPQRCWISMCCAPQPELILDTRVFFECAGWSNKFWTVFKSIQKLFTKNNRKMIQNWSSISFKNDQNWVKICPKWVWKYFQKRYQNVVKMVSKIGIKTC